MQVYKLGKVEKSGNFCILFLYKCIKKLVYNFESQWYSVWIFLSAGWDWVCNFTESSFSSEQYNNI